MGPVAVGGHWTRVRWEADAALSLRHGRAIPWSGEADSEFGNPIAVTDETGLIGIAEIRDGHLAPKKILRVLEPSEDR